MLDVLSTIGGKCEQLCDRSHGFPRFQKCLTQGTSKWRTAWLAGRNNIDSARLQLIREHAKLGRLAAAVNSFKSDEFSSQDDGSSGAGLRSCEMDEIACLKMRTSGPPTSSSTENLSKLFMRPESVEPCSR